MTKMPVSRLIASYISDKGKTAVFFLFTMLLFFTACLLFQLENMRHLLYAFFLWAFSALCFAVYDFIKYIERYKMLLTAFENLGGIVEVLPLPSGSLELEYHKIIAALAEELRQLRSKVSLKETDMADYYTMWAHQIKIPIAAMRLLLQSIDEGLADTGKPVDDTSGDTLSNNGAIMTQPFNSKLLSEELFKIEHYVDMILYYQRLDSITSDFLFKKYDLHHIVRQALKKHSMFFINNRLSLDFNEFSCFVVTDEKWLQFVLGQVLSNALKYTSRGGISIRLEATDEKDLLIIEDTGIGIRPEDLPRIFERGYTGYNGRLDKKSTGIGLYLCRQILNKLSHTIEVSSEVGRGTIVTIGFTRRPELLP